MTLAARARSLNRCVTWLAPFTGGWARALGTLVTFKYNPSAMQQGHYNQAPFSFGLGDLSAIKEVLADQEYAFLTPVLRATPAPIVLDIGAHIGTFALWVSAQNSSAQIYSLEASPSTFSRLTRNREQLANENWRVIHGAAYGTAGQITFQDAGESMSGRVNANGGSVSVPCLTLADLLARCPSGQEIDIAKIDIEGSEESFLCAAPELLVRIKNLVIELHPHYCNTGRVRAVLAAVYPRITEIPGRTSSKPLMFCERGD